MKKLLLILFSFFAFTAFAQFPPTQVTQGGTGWGNLQGTDLLIGNWTGRISTSSNLTYATSTNRLTLLYASTTAFSVTNLDVSGTCTGCSALQGGTVGMLSAWTSATALTATSAPTAAFYIATSTTDTSRFAGLIAVNGNGTSTFSGAASTTRIVLGDGSQGYPALTFSSESSMGLHRPSTGVLDIDAPTQIRLDLGGATSIFNFTSTYLKPTLNNSVDLGGFGNAFGNLMASGTVYAANFVDSALTGNNCIGESAGLLGQATNCVSSIASAGGSLTVSSPTGNVDVSINPAHSNYYSALQNFTNASTSQFTATSSAYLATVSGNVGIGTTSPGSLLSVGNANGINFQTGTSTSNATGGFDLTAGCFSIRGTCVASGLPFGISFNVASSSMSTTTRASQYKAPAPLTLTSISCSTVSGTSTIQLDIRSPSTPNTAGTNILFAGGLACGSGANQTASTTFNTTAITALNLINLQILDASPTGNPATLISVHIQGTK